MTVSADPLATLASTRRHGRHPRFETPPGLFRALTRTRAAVLHVPLERHITRVHAGATAYRGAVFTFPRQRESERSATGSHTDRPSAKCQDDWPGAPRADEVRRTAYVEQTKDRILREERPDLFAGAGWLPARTRN